MYNEHSLDELLERYEEHGPDLFNSLAYSELKAAMLPISFIREDGAPES